MADATPPSRAPRLTPDSPLAPGELGRGAVSGVLTMSLGNAGRAVLRVALLAVLGRLLEPVSFGLVGAAGIVIWFGMIFAGLGVAAALIQRESLEPRHVATAVTSSIALGILGAGIVYVAAPVLEQALRVPGLTPVLRWLSLVFPIVGVSAVAECMLQRRLRFGVIAGGELVSYAVGYGVVGVWLAFAGFGVWALVAAELTKVAVKALMFLRAVPAARHVAFDPQAFRELMRFGSGYSASSLASYAASQGDVAVVARTLGPAALGYYGRAFELMLVPAQSLGIVLDKVLFAAMAKLQDRPDALRRAYHRATALVALLVLPVSAVTVILAPEIIAVLLGSAWAPAAVPLRILAAGMYFRVGYMIGHAVANSTGATHAAAGRSVVYAALVVVGAVVGVRWGLAGVATGVLVAVAANFAMVFLLAERITGTRTADYLALHLAGARLALLLGGEAWLIDTAAAAIGIGAIGTLVASVAVIAITVVALVRLWPRFLGDDAWWIVDMLYDHVPTALQPLVRRTLARSP